MNVYVQLAAARVHDRSCVFAILKFFSMCALPVFAIYTMKIVFLLYQLFLKVSAEKRLFVMLAVSVYSFSSLSVTKVACVCYRVCLVCVSALKNVCV